MVLYIVKYMRYYLNIRYKWTYVQMFIACLKLYAGQYDPGNIASDIARWMRPRDATLVRANKYNARALRGWASGQ